MSDATHGPLANTLKVIAKVEPAEILSLIHILLKTNRGAS